MPKRLDDLYHSFFKEQDFNELKLSMEENHRILIDRLSKEDRKTVLRIIDALGMICNYQSKASFIQGFGLGMELTTEESQSILGTGLLCRLWKALGATSCPHHERKQEQLRLLHLQEVW